MALPRMLAQHILLGMDDATSAVLLVAPNLNASLIGAGPTGAPLQPEFGNVDFKAYNIDFENRAVGPCRFNLLLLAPETCALS